MPNIKTASLDEIREMYARGEISAPSSPVPAEDLPDGFWDDAEVVVRPTKHSVHLRVDQEVFDYFHAGGKGHLTRMNQVLRTYVEGKLKLEGRDPKAAKMTINKNSGLLNKKDKGRGSTSSKTG